MGLLLKIIFIMYNFHINNLHDEFTLKFNIANDEGILKKIKYI